MEKSYIEYLKSIRDGKINDLVHKYESGVMDFETLTGLINPVLFEGVVTYYTFTKDKKIDGLFD